MSTFSELRAAWDAWCTGCLGATPKSWTLDPQAMLLKLPVRVELDGPHSIRNILDRDEITYVNDGAPKLKALREAKLTIKAISRDHITHPAELTLERVRAGLRRPDLRAILLAADCSIRQVGQSVRYDVKFEGRVESVAAVEVTFGWAWDDTVLTGPDFGVIESVQGPYEVNGEPQTPEWYAEK